MSSNGNSSAGDGGGAPESAPAPDLQQPAAGIGSSGNGQKFKALVMTLYPCSIANIIFFAAAYILLAMFVVPQKMDPYTGAYVADWAGSLPYAVALYFPLSFAYHYVNGS